MANKTFYKPEDIRTVRLSYPSVSRRVGIFRKKLRVDKIFKKKYDKISILIKMTPLGTETRWKVWSSLRSASGAASIVEKRCKGGDRNATE
ncbi:MAG: hypothetical protein JRD93_15490 [Deltaproteobacteria bacterium]|nr:hypothetical protein [Deltaproteobacteria bacterium]